MNDIKDLMDVEVGGIKIARKKEQKKLDVIIIGTGICRFCEEKFNVDEGYIGIYCSRKCYDAYSRSMKFKAKLSEGWKKRKDGSYEFKNTD